MATRPNGKDDTPPNPIVASMADIIISLEAAERTRLKLDRELAAVAKTHSIFEAQLDHLRTVVLRQQTYIAKAKQAAYHMDNP